jgi:hypothetical protein
LDDLKASLAATLLVAVSLFLWGRAVEFGDWSILSLFPLAIFIFLGSSAITLPPLKAKLGLALRDASILRRILTGKLRTILTATAFTGVSVLILAWQTLEASLHESVAMLLVLLLSGFIFFQIERLFLRDFKQPFARSYAASAATWAVALPFLFVLAYTAMSKERPGELLNASLAEAIRIGVDDVPLPDGWLSTFLAFPYAYEDVKLWAVVQASDYPVVAYLFSLDAALFSFVLARTGVVLTQYLGAYRLFGKK